MMRFALLVSLLGIALVSSTKYTSVVKISPNGELTITTSGGSSDSSSSDASIDAANAGPSAAEIALIRQTWEVAKADRDIPIRTLTEHFKIHPKTQALFPKFANVPVDQLTKNSDFLQQAYSCVVFGLNFMINNLDNPTLLESALKRADGWGKWYVDYMTLDRQIQETVRIFLKVLEEEMGDKLTEEAKEAWSKGMKFAFSFMGTTGVKASGKSALSNEAVERVRKSWELMKDNINIAENCMIKHFVLHPPVQKLYPAFADVPVAELKGNADFQVQAHQALKVIHIIVQNLDNNELLTRLLTKVTIPGYFVDYMDPIHQLDETTRLFLEAVEEELGSKFSGADRAAWQKAFDHVNDIMAAAATVSVNGVALDSNVKRIVPRISSKDRQLVRDSWYLARRNSNIAPKVFFRMFDAHPETQKMFPRFANLSRDQLLTNKDFMNTVYTCFAGLNFMIKGLDDTYFLTNQLKKFASPVFYVEGPNAAQQLDETTRIMLDVMQEELGAAFDSETRVAWNTVLGFIHGILAKENDPIALTEGEKQIMRDIWTIAKTKHEGISGRMMIKLFRAHPDAQSLFPGFADVPLNGLEKNREFQAYDKMFTAGISLMIDNIDDPKFIKSLLAGKPKEQYFSAGISLTQQLEETGRVILETLDEELGPRLSPRSRRAWARGLRFLNSVMAESFA